MKFLLALLALLPLKSHALEHVSCVMENYRKDKQTRDLFKKLDPQVLFEKGLLFVRHGRYEPDFEMKSHSQRPLRIRIAKYEKREEFYSLETKFKKKNEKICRLELILESPIDQKNQYQIEAKLVAERTEFVGALGDKHDCSKLTWEKLRDQLIEKLPYCHRI